MNLNGLRGTETKFLLCCDDQTASCFDDARRIRLGLGVIPVERDSSSTHAGSGGSFYALVMLQAGRDVGIAVLANSAGERTVNAADAVLKALLAKYALCSNDFLSDRYARFLRYLRFLRYAGGWRIMIRDSDQIETIVEPIQRPATPRRAEGAVPAGHPVSQPIRIISCLGKGGMGEVFRADDLILGQPVALKFLPESAKSNVNLLTRFYDEVRIARQISTRTSAAFTTSARWTASLICRWSTSTVRIWGVCCAASAVFPPTKPRSLRGSCAPEWPPRTRKASFTAI